MARYRAPIRRLGPDRFEVELSEAETDLLSALVPQLRALLGSDDPSLRRLFPVAYANDPELDAGYQVLARDELLTKRLESLDVMEATLSGEGIRTGDELRAFLRACNDIRLVLGTRLDVSEDPTPPDPDGPDASAYAVYDYLGMLLTWTIDALDGDL